MEIVRVIRALGGRGRSKFVPKLNEAPDSGEHAAAPGKLN